jgi:hypothetical protein
MRRGFQGAVLSSSYLKVLPMHSAERMQPSFHAHLKRLSRGDLLLCAGEPGPTGVVCSCPVSALRGLLAGLSTIVGLRVWIDMGACMTPVTVPTYQWCTSTSKQR